MPILLCFQKKSKVAMYRRLSEARNLACIRRYGLQTSEVPAPASPPASAFGTFPAPTRGQVSRPDPHHTPMPSDSGSSRLNRAPICSGAGCLDWGSVRPGALRQWGLAALWRPCMLLQTPAIEPAPSTQAAGRCAVCPWINVHAAFLCRKDRWQLCMVIRYGWQNSMGSA